MPSDSPLGRARASDSTDDNNAFQFVVQSLLLGVRTSQPVLVVSCTNSGGVSPVGTVTIKPLVGQVDGDGNVIEHGQLYNVPYLRIQGGANGVILDPEPGDIGLATFCDRDISVVIKSGAAGPPGSRRRHDMSDGIYIGTIIGAAPAQYVRFHAGGIVIHSPTKVRVEAPIVEVAADTITSSGAWTHHGTITSAGDITADGISLIHHLTTEVKTGTDRSGPPVAP